MAAVYPIVWTTLISEPASLQYVYIYLYIYIMILVLFVIYIWSLLQVAGTLSSRGKAQRKLCVQLEPVHSQHGMMGVPVAAIEMPG